MLDHNYFYKLVMEDQDVCFSDEDLFECTRIFIDEHDFINGIMLNKRASELIGTKYEHASQICASKLARVNLNLGACYEMNREYECASQSFCDAIKMAKKAYTLENSDDNKELVALSLYYLAGHLRYINQAEKAIMPYVVSTKLLSELKADKDATNMLEYISEHLYEIYTTHQSEDMPVLHYEYDELVNDLYTLDELKNLARKYEIEGNEFEEDDETEDAKEYYVLSHAMRHILSQMDKNPMTIHEYAFGKIRLAKIVMKESKRESKRWYESALFVLGAVPEYANEPIIELDSYIATESLKNRFDGCIRRRAPKDEMPSDIYTKCEKENSPLFKNVLIITGPSAVGKSTLADVIKKRVPNVRRVISTTSRAPRPNEVNGIDYNFISKEKFENKIANEEFLETTYYNGNNYGILKEELEACGENELLLFVVDTVGAKNLKIHVPLATTVFIKPPSIEVLKDRIKKRNANTPSEMEWRIAIAQREMDEADKFDYVVINDDIDECARQIMEVMKW